MAEKRTRGIKYVLGDKQAGVSWSEDTDNPLSPAFVPLTQRTEADRVRFWARAAQRRRDTRTHTVFDP